MEMCLSDRVGNDVPGSLSLFRLHMLGSDQS